MSASSFLARTLDGMSWMDTMVTLPSSDLAYSRVTKPWRSRSCMYVQNWVCFRACSPYSSHTTAYVFSTAEVSTARLLFMTLAVASSTAMRLTSRPISLASDT